MEPRKSNLEPHELKSLWRDFEGDRQQVFQEILNYVHIESDEDGGRSNYGAVQAFLRGKFHDRMKSRKINDIAFDMWQLLPELRSKK